MDSGRILALVGVVMVALGSFLDWVVVASAFGSTGLSGMEGDGPITLGLAIVAGVLLLVSSRRRGLIGVTVALALVLLVGIYDITSTQNKIDAADNEFYTATVGNGLYLVVAAAVIGLIGCVICLKHLKLTPAPPTPTAYFTSPPAPAAPAPPTPAAPAPAPAPAPPASPAPSPSPRERVMPPTPRVETRGTAPTSQPPANVFPPPNGPNA